MDKDSEQQKALLNKMANYSARYFKTEFEIKCHFLQKGYEQTEIEEALVKLRSYGYVNDSAVAQAIVSAKSKSAGARKIKFELFKKGVPRELAESALNEINSNQAEDAAIRAAQKYMLRRQPTPENKARLYRFLTGRGFDGNDIAQAVKLIFNHNEFSE